MLSERGAVEARAAAASRNVDVLQRRVTALVRPRVLRSRFSWPCCLHRSSSVSGRLYDEIVVGVLTELPMHPMLLQESDLATCDEARIKAEESSLRLDRKCASLTREVESLKCVLKSYDAEVRSPVGGRRVCVLFMLVGTVCVLGEINAWNAGSKSDNAVSRRWSKSG